MVNIQADCMAFACFCFIFLFLLIRIFWLQVIDAKELQQKALSQWTRPTTVTAERGMIIDCNGQTLAKDGPVYKIVIWPNSISESDRVRVATELSRVLDLNYEKVLERVSSGKLREFILKRQVSKEACDEIRSLQLGGGVGISPDTKRYYPFGTLLSQTIGFTSTDGTGQSGLELTYNKYLTGKDGERIAETDSRGNQIADSMIQEFPPTDGSTLKLTVDANIQSYLENALAEAVQVNNAKMHRESSWMSTPVPSLQFQQNPTMTRTPPRGTTCRCLPSFPAIAL